MSKHCYYYYYYLLLHVVVVVVHYSDWVCTAVMSNDVMKDLRG